MGSVPMQLLLEAHSFPALSPQPTYAAGAGAIVGSEARSRGGRSTSTSGEVNNREWERGPGQ